MRDALETRFSRSVADAGGTAIDGDWPPYSLPEPLLQSIVEADARGLCPPSLIAHYTERMPAMLVEQRRAGDEPRRLLRRPLRLEDLPRTRAALDGFFAALTAHDLDPRRFTGVASTAELIAARPTLESIYAHALFGSGLPLVGAYPSDAPSLMQAIAAHGADGAIDRRLGCHVVHELCHGPPRACEKAPPWLVVEAAANHLGAAARAADVFPDEAGEGLRAVSLFVLVGDVLARHFGAAALWRVNLGEPLPSLFGAEVAAALDAAAWEDWRARQEPPFARDALGAAGWIKLIDAARANLPLDDAPLARARALPWTSLPWWHAPVDDADVRMLPRALAALFQVNALAPDFRTVPDEPPGRRLLIDVADARIFAEPRAHGWGEPASWIFPPPLARSLFERGARRIRIEGATRKARAALADALVELGAQRRPLAAELELVWDSSR